MDPAAPPPRVVVVGAGISGLVAAWTLARSRPDLEVVVLEQAPHVGGKLRVSDVAGVPVDEGAEALLTRRPEGAQLVAEAGLADALLPAATTDARVFSRGVLHPFPSGHVLGVPTDLRAVRRSGLLTPAELLRLRLDLVLPGPTVSAADGIAAGTFLARRLGGAVVRRLVEPLLGGVYAGRADRLSLGAVLPQLAAALTVHGSVLRAARQARAASPPAAGPVFSSLRGGLGRLPAALAAGAMDVRTGVTVREVRRDGEGWQLVCGPASGRVSETLHADAVVVATPAPATARLLRTAVPAAAAALAAVEYASVAVVTLAFRRAELSAQSLALLTGGSGFLVPAEERLLTKGLTVSSTKWGWYAEDVPDLVLMRASIGRHGDEFELQRTDEELVAAVCAELATAVGVATAPVDSRVTRWGGALPQYAPGHAARMDAVRRALGEDALATLAVCGAAYDGVGVPACIASGRAAADRVLHALAASATMRA